MAEPAGMEITFISMHDLSPEARLVFVSDSITDVLGYEPSEVVGRSLFSYFHPDEIPFAQSFHGRGVQMDKAAVLAYCKLRSKSGEYIYCEIVFTVVYSVVVAATSVYRQTMKSHERALKAPVIRRAFSSSQRDPRYHMLAHLSPKFNAPSAGLHEPRAALILNRFTRSLTILYATHAMREILNFDPNEAVGLSFFEFISQDCLQDAVEALERAKENDSIAYLRFHCRDPRIPEVIHESPNGLFRIAGISSILGRTSNQENIQREMIPTISGRRGSSQEAEAITSRSAGYDNKDGDYQDNAKDDLREAGSSSCTIMPGTNPPINRGPEVEAVVSCTSDGLVVVVRRARPMIPLLDPHAAQLGIFASSPWSTNPFHPPAEPSNGTGGPDSDEFMDSIRQIAVFAWCLRSINENMVQYARTEPEGDFKLTQPRNLVRNNGADDTTTFEKDEPGFEDGSKERPIDLTSDNDGHIGKKRKRTFDIGK